MITTGLVSIIIPMYNAQDFIAPVIESVCSQTYLNWELIIVDDGSTDSSIEVAIDKAQNNPNIRVIQRPSHIRKGGNACRNYGLSLSSGEYVLFVDADDLLATYCLEQRVDFMKKNPSLDFGIFPAITFQHKPFDYSDSYFGFKKSKKALHKLISKTLPFVVWNNIYRHEVLLSKDIKWDENLMSHQDADFNINCIINGLKYKEADCKIDYFWRVVINDNSVSKHINSEKKFKNNIYYYEKIWNLIKDKNKYSSDFKNLTLYFIKLLSKNPNNKDLISQFMDSIPYKGQPFIFKQKVNLFLKLGTKYAHIWSLLLFPYIDMQRRKNDEIWPFRQQRIKRINLLLKKTLQNI